MRRGLHSSFVRFSTSTCTVLLSSVVALAGAPALTAQAPTLLTPGQSHYSVMQEGKTLGDAHYSIAIVPGGYTLASSGHMNLAKFSYSFHNEAVLDGSLNLAHDTLTGAVNGTKAHASNVTFAAASDPTGREFQISISAGGKQTSNSVDRHRNTVLVPDLDPAAYLLMARLAIAQPQNAWVLIPKEDGLLVPAAYELKADLAGSLRGANINVKHATAALSDANSITIELYYTPDGQLLEADLNAQNLDVVLDGFKLTDRPAPTPPPPGQAPQQPDQAAPQQPVGMPPEPQAP